MAKATSRGGQRSGKGPLFSELTTNLWWEYRKYTEEELLSLDNFLQHEAPKEIQLTNDIYDNLKKLYIALGLHFHPFINYPLIKTIPPEVLESIKQAIAAAEANNAKKGAVPMEKPEIPQCEVVQINNIKVDPVVLKLLVFCWGASKLTTLKLIRNQFEDHVEEAMINAVSNPNFKLSKLFLDWNPPINFSIYPKILHNPNIQFLCLRSCNLTDSSLQILINALKENTSLKSLDLYGNQITGEGANKFAELLESSCNLESVGLAKNQLSQWSDVQHWLENIGRFPITLEEVEEYKQKEKDREVIVQKNLKNKGKKGYIEEHVPFLYPIQQVTEGKWVMKKGSKLKMISLALNKFDNESLGEFEKLLTRMEDDSHLVLTANPIGQKEIEVLKQKFNTKLIF